MSLLDQLTAMFDAAGIPRYVWQPIAEQESGLDPLAWNRNGEDSRGLFQINVGAHPEYAGLDLFDPLVNAQIALRDFIRPAWEKVKGASDPGVQAGYVWRYGIKPDYNAPSFAGKFQSLMDRARAVAGAPPGGDPGVPPDGGLQPAPTSTNPLTGEFWQGAGLKIAFGLGLGVLILGGGWAMAKAFGADGAIVSAGKTAAKAAML